MTISLDEYMAGPNVSVKHAMGEGGDRLHEWIFAAKTKMTERFWMKCRKTTGAVIIGKTMFDVGLQHWEDTPLRGFQPYFLNNSKFLSLYNPITLSDRAT
jgi:hypothetical protein